MLQDTRSLYEFNRNLFNQYPERIKEIMDFARKEIAEKLSLSNDQPLVVNGHQIIFYHPGLIAKEILAYSTATRVQGRAISIILDHDPNDMIFSYPEFIFEKSQIRIKKKYTLLASKDSFSNFNLELKLSGFKNNLENILSNLKAHYKDDTYQFLSDNFKLLLNHVHESSTEFVVNTRIQSLKKIGVDLSVLKISELVNFQSWQNYCEWINSDIEEFTNIYNLALHEYRAKHGIKNHAQPVPDLKTEELPFWIVNKDGKRAKATYPDKGKIMLPRAITLSIFLRLFVSDIFIHGTGGAKYDHVTNLIIQKFFKVTPAAFLVKTASLKIPILESSPVYQYRKIRSLNTWQTDYRNFQYHPENIPGHDEALIKERFRLIDDLRQANLNRKQIHEQLENNRLEILNRLRDYENNMQIELEIIKKYSKDKSVLMDRSLPYFFYDPNELMSDNHYNIIFP